MNQPRKLITEEVRRSLGRLNTTDDAGGSAVAVVKYTKPDGSAKFYATEFDGVEVFYGLVDRGAELGAELGSWTLSFLQSWRDGFGRPIVRDVYFQPKKLREICPDLFLAPTGADVGLFAELPAGAAPEPVDAGSPIAALVATATAVAGRGPA